MSIVFPYQQNNETNDFYQSIQYLNESTENNENFGKFISNPSLPKEIRRTYSSKDLNLLAYQGEIKRNFSMQSFQENESDLLYRKVHFFEDRSTAESFSSFTSLNSSKSTAKMYGKPKQKNAQNKKVINSGSETNFRQKYKTEVCKYWAQKGFCEFGDQCAFAHGNDEIRQKCHVSSNYKTKKCNQFHETGYCPYGVRCQFIHSLRKDCQDKNEPTTYTDAMENPEIWVTHDPDCVCMQKKSRKRLPSFLLLSTNESSSSDDNKENHPNDSN